MLETLRVGIVAVGISYRNITKIKNRRFHLTAKTEKKKENKYKLNFVKNIQRW
jgi:hypothetical protein